MTVGELMSSPARAVRPETPLKAAAAMMAAYSISGLPVVDADGQLQGVVSMNDIVLASQQNRKPSASDIVSTMASICAHRTVQAVTT